MGFYFIILALIGILGEIVFFKYRYSDIISEGAIEKLTHQLPSLSVGQKGFINFKTLKCHKSQDNIDLVTPGSKAISGILGMSDIDIQASITGLSALCLKQFVDSARTIEDMIVRNKLLGSLSPYLSSETFKNKID